MAVVHRRRTRWLTTGLVVLLALGFSALVPAPAAQASGGRSIAGAPTLVYGALEVGGGAQSEFWRMPVTQGDLVTFDIEAGVGNIYQVLDFRPLDPSITDYTVRARHEDGLGQIDPGKSQVTWRSPFTGTGTLWVTNWRDAPEPMSSYNFTATLAHATTLAISAPTLAKRGSRVTVRATISSPAGAPQGTCLIAGKPAPVVSGRCSGHVRLGYGHRQTIHVEFVPGDGWQATSGHRTIRLYR